MLCCSLPTTGSAFRAKWQEDMRGKRATQIPYMLFGLLCFWSERRIVFHWSFRCTFGHYSNCHRVTTTLGGAAFGNAWEQGWEKDKKRRKFILLSLSCKGQLPSSRIRVRDLFELFLSTYSTQLQDLCCSLESRLGDTVGKTNQETQCQID